MDGDGWVVTKGEADAARSCSSRLDPMADAGDDLTAARTAGFADTWEGEVGGSDVEIVMLGNGSVVSLKRRPLRQLSVRSATKRRVDDAKTNKME